GRVLVRLPAGAAAGGLADRGLPPRPVPRRHRDPGGRPVRGHPRRGGRAGLLLNPRVRQAGVTAGFRRRRPGRDRVTRVTPCDTRVTATAATGGGTTGRGWQTG